MLNDRKSIPPKTLEALRELNPEFLIYLGNNDETQKNKKRQAKGKDYVCGSEAIQEEEFSGDYYR